MLLFDLFIRFVSSSFGLPLSLIFIYAYLLLSLSCLLSKALILNCRETSRFFNGAESSYVNIYSDVYVYGINLIPVRVSMLSLRAKNAESGESYF